MAAVEAVPDLPRAGLQAYATTISSITLFWHGPLSLLLSLLVSVLTLLSPCLYLSAEISFCSSTHLSQSKLWALTTLYKA